jgi:hypothetical protein
METKFNFNSQVCTDKNQSERLLALGLKPETADIRGVEGIEHTPTYAWSLHRLWMSIPKYIEIGEGNEYEIVMIHGYLKLINDLDDVYKYFDNNDSIYDNIIDCIEWLIKEGYFNEEYLNKEE